MVAKLLQYLDYVNQFSVHRDQRYLMPSRAMNEDLRIFALSYLPHFKTTSFILLTGMTTIICSSHYQLLQLVSSGLFTLFFDCSTFCCFRSFPVWKKIMFLESSVGRVLLFLYIKLTTRPWGQLQNFKLFLVVFICIGRISTGIRLYSGGETSRGQEKERRMFQAEIFFGGWGWQTNRRWVKNKERGLQRCFFYCCF